jgi:hypothetical protein
MQKLIMIFILTNILMAVISFIPFPFNLMLVLSCIISLLITIIIKLGEMTNS